MRGFLITLEGIDGCGKTTLARSLAEYYRSKGHSVLLTKEPGGTSFGAHIRTLLQEGTYNLDCKAEFLLFAADRAYHITRVVEPALKAGSIVISDRMADSSLAYQGFGRGLDVETLSRINAWAMNGIQPDITFYLAVDYETASNRIAQRSEKKTTFENEQASFFGAVITGFETIFKDRSNVVKLDGTFTADVIYKQALQVLETML